MKKVLITGIDSFTGEYLKNSLVQDGYLVVGSTYQTCNITDKAAVKALLKKEIPDFIIHLAGIAFAAHGNPADFYSVNTIGTTNILDSLIELELNPKKIILASSATIYGNQGKEILDETLCPKPANHYGASKFAMESLASNYFSKLNIIITRPFNYTGVGQTENFLIPKIVKHYKEKKEFIELGNLDVSREFNDVYYICNLYKKLLNSEEKSVATNLASNNPIKLLDVIEMMNSISGYKIEVKVNPTFVRKDEIKTLTGSTKRLFSLIEKEQPRDFRETLKEMYEA